MEENKAQQKLTLETFYSLNAIIHYHANDMVLHMHSLPRQSVHDLVGVSEILIKNAVKDVITFNVTGFENQKRKLVEEYKSAKGYERIKIGLTISSLNSRIKDNNVTRSTLKHEDEYIALKSYLKQKGIDLTEFFETLKR